MKITRLLGATTLALLLTLSVAHASTTNDPVTAVDGAGALLGSNVTLPWGAYVSAILGWAQEIFVAIAAALVAFASRQLPAWAVALVKDYLSQQRIARAVHYAFTQVDGAVQGRTLELTASNALVAAAETYMLRLAPTVAAQLGDRLKPMILAQIAKLGSAPDQAMPHVLPAKPVSPAVEAWGTKPGK